MPAASILVIKLDHIGDFLIAAPAFALLRQSFPDARISLLCGPWNVPVAQASGLFDDVTPLAYFASRAEAGRVHFDGAVIANLGSYDLAIDLRVDEDTRPVLAQIAAHSKAGYGPAGLAGMSIALPRPAIATDLRRDLLAHQRQCLLNLVAAVIGCHGPDQTAMLVRRLASPLPHQEPWRRPVIAMTTGSGRAIKNWPLARFIALARRLLAELGGTLVLLGGADQRPDALRLRAELGEAHVVDLVGALPIQGSLSVLAQADLFVGNDTALGHASAAFGIPTIVIFSGIDPLPNWTPLGPRAVAVKAEVNCSPCHLSDLALCPNQHICVEGITVERVMQEIAALTPGGLVSP